MSTRSLKRRNLSNLFSGTLTRNSFIQLTHQTNNQTQFGQSKANEPIELLGQFTAEINLIICHKNRHVSRHKSEQQMFT